MKIRKCDKWGCGHYGAGRGSRKHMGVDIVSNPGDPWESLNGGVVTKVGYPYANDLSFRYVEVTDQAGAKWRYFYVQPSVKVGDVVEPYSEIGTVQKLGDRYPGITEHVHLEIIKIDGDFVDPTSVISEDWS